MIVEIRKNFFSANQTHAETVTENNKTTRESTEKKYKRYTYDSV